MALASLLRYTRCAADPAAEIRRLMEDKSFDVRPMIETLGFEPMPLQEGLARTFADRS